MALRTPTTFNVFNSLSRIKPKGEILAAHHDDVLDDQQFALDRGEVLCSYVGPILTISGAAWVTAMRLSVRGRDMCGTAAAATESVEFCINAKCSVDNNFIVGIYDPITSAWCGMTISANRTSYKWRGWTVDVGSALSLPTDGTVSELLIGGYVPAPGTGNVSISGVGIFV
jgi:hypothetical protein